MKIYPISFGNRKLRNILILTTLVFLISSCNSPLENEENDGGYNIDLPIFPNSYSEPSVSPDGEQILFRRVKITNFNSGGGYNIDYDSTGIWIAQSDGSDMRLLLKYGGSPSLSPDGQWMVFESGAQIYKIPFEDGDIDTTGLVQLTDRGRNFHPAWSPDGEWIAYGRSVCEGENTCGVWEISFDGAETNFIDSYGMYPTWHPVKMNILYIKRAVTTNGQVLGDSILIFNTETNEKKNLTLLMEKI